MHSCVNHRALFSRRVILQSQSGFTILELVVSSFLGLLMTGIFIGLMQTNRNVLGKDTARITLNQSLRGAMDVVGADVRLAGENLSANFPAVELINAAAGTEDILVLRRNLLDEILPVCIQIDAGSSVNNVYFAIAGTTPGCVYSGQTHSYNSWRNYRLAEPGQITSAYIYNTVTKEGEFFTYVNEVNDGVQYALVRSNGTWQYTYPVGSSAVYILEEWRYTLNGENLQLIENQDVANPFDVSFAINDFQSEIILQDGTALQTFTANDDWTQIASIRINLQGNDLFRGEAINKTLSAAFFPRNVLSN